MLQGEVHREAWNAFLAQRRLLEQDVGDSLVSQLLRAMERRGEPLRVQEKVDMLREAIASYKGKVGRLLPQWAASRGDSEQGEVERRLGELQFGIEESAEGRSVRGLWEQRRNKRVMSERAHGVSVSLDPGLRIMVRPEGLGNLQIFSSGPVGPPSSPAKVHLGIMNDGSIADVYREHPVPPKISVQPAVQVNLNIR